MTSNHREASSTFTTQTLHRNIHSLWLSRTLWNDFNDLLTYFGTMSIVINRKKKKENNEEALERVMHTSCALSFHWTSGRIKPAERALFFFFRESLWETINKNFFLAPRSSMIRSKKTSTWPVKSRQLFSYFFINWNKKLLDYKLELLYEISFQFVFKQAKHMHLKWHSRSGVTVVKRWEWYWTRTTVTTW